MAFVRTTKSINLKLDLRELLEKQEVSSRKSQQAYQWPTPNWMKQAATESGNRRRLLTRSGQPVTSG